MGSPQARAPRIAAGILPAAPSAVPSKPGRVVTGKEARHSGCPLPWGVSASRSARRPALDKAAGGDCTPRQGDHLECPLGTKLALGPVGRQEEREVHLSSSHLQRGGRDTRTQCVP